MSSSEKEELRAKLAVMTATLEFYAEAANYVAVRIAADDIIEAPAWNDRGERARQALFAVPKVEWSGEAIRTGVGNGWTSIMLKRGDIWAVPVKLDTERFRIYVLADDKPQEGDNTESPTSR